MSEHPSSERPVTEEELPEHGLARYGEAAGTWDPMPWHLDRAYRVAGRDAQHAFWGQGEVERLSMLHQLALQIAS